MIALEIGLENVIRQPKISMEIQACKNKNELLVSANKGINAHISSPN